jgi:hypothetical protein
MTPQQHIEMTIRVAKLIKSLSRLIRVRDEVLASLMVNECIGEFKDLADFTVKLKSSKT